MNLVETESYQNPKNPRTDEAGVRGQKCEIFNQTIIQSELRAVATETKARFGDSIEALHEISTF